MVPVEVPAQVARKEEVIEAELIEQPLVEVIINEPKEVGDEVPITCTFSSHKWEASAPSDPSPPPVCTPEASGHIEADENLPCQIKP